MRVWGKLRLAHFDEAYDAAKKLVSPGYAPLLIYSDIGDSSLIGDRIMLESQGYW